MERYCKSANKTTQQLYKVSTPCIDDHHFKEEEMKYVGDLSQVCSQIVLKCLYLARTGRPDIPWSVNKLARSITKWTKACDKRLNRLISYFHHTCEYKQYCYVGKILPNNADWDCFKTRILREILRTQNPFLEKHCAWPEGCGRRITGGGGLARVPNLRVCANTSVPPGGTCRRDECRGTVQSAWQYLKCVAKEGELGLPKRVSGRHVVRGRQPSPILAQARRVSVAVIGAPG